MKSGTHPQIGAQTNGQVSPAKPVLRQKRVNAAPAGYRCSLINLDNSHDDELDAILGERCDVKGRYARAMRRTAAALQVTRVSVAQASQEDAVAERDGSEVSVGDLREDWRRRRRVRDLEVEEHCGQAASAPGDRHGRWARHARRSKCDE